MSNSKATSRESFADGQLQGTKGLPYYTYDLTGSDWTATFAVVDSDCFLSSYQEVGQQFDMVSSDAKLI